ncbi:MAG: hypothetical protein FWH08_01065 [Oscillospiraceae bacterium]|nr:hypothetical protein [Oscillospiraceae bacterium]
MKNKNLAILVIPVEKFVKYSLEPLQRADKARAFRLALGYDKTNYKLLIDQIVSKLKRYDPKPKGNDGFGMRYETVVRIKGANGKTASVRTVWNYDKSSGETIMTNAYVENVKGGKSMSGIVATGNKVRLTNGLIAWIIEELDQSVFLAEILGTNGTIEQTSEIKTSDIKSVFVEYEEPYQIEM